MNRSRLLATLAATAAVATGAALAAPAQGAPVTPSAKGVTHADNPGVPKGASWSEQYFSSPRAGAPSKVTLHADIFRPANLPANAKTPVIISMGPYFNHSGQTGRETDTYQPTSRFDDLIDGAQLMKRGYTFIAVDLRGFGASTGCLDWVGPGEQADIKASVEWAASRPWSTGKVGTYGKSYDAVTGLWANDLKPKGLKAVVAQEPLWNMYPYLYSNDVPRPNQDGTPLAYNSIAGLGGTTGDSARYKAAADYEKQHPECYTRNLHDNVSNTSADDKYWKVRNHAALAKGTTTPLFVTQGFTESNTKPEQMEQFLSNHVGPERGWLGPWEHVRGNDVDPTTGRLAQGRKNFFGEVVRFYDQYLKGIKPTVKDPNYAIQDNFGSWRAQTTWPVTQNRSLVTLQPGKYIDSGPVADQAPAAGARRAGDANGKGLTAVQAEKVRDNQVPTRRTQRSGQDVDQRVTSQLGTAAQRRAAKLSDAAAVPNSYQTWSKPVKVSTRLTGTPRIILNTRGQGEVYVGMWDVAPDKGTATLINENVAELTKSGRTFDLKSLDWTLPKGHRLAVTIGTIQGGYWYINASGRTITVNDAQLQLAVQSTAHDVKTEGSKSAFLDSYIADNTIPSGVIPRGTFEVPTP
ncbi:CocE/NonD family hydrolase [Luteipulveratus mongoliensis]|uniref:Xaa-Pro dipeptidyl-peptidase C-terminal domain-containing protein n=1 Tax=Luteipulveratus mongoliensis TaxID=571913 RepID=A0A0K1JHM5_9MICO|nr:CocE/NonD family hydrolase [Luteipulveratus mongoliensis]AKU16212.1 hypothetical protein VV02_10650 [Luteipulveratus mongoliensis]